MNEQFLNPRETIIKELIDRGSYDRIYDLSTLQFLKMHASDSDHQLHYISCCELSGEQHWLYIVMELEGEYWEIDTVWPTTPYDQSKPQEKFQDLPHAALACTQGGGIAKSFCAFGEVIDKNFTIRNVKLISSNSTVLEDQVEQELVLFTSNGILDYPIWAELYNETGICVNRHLLFDIPRRRPLIDR